MVNSIDNRRNAFGHNFLIWFVVFFSLISTLESFAAGESKKPNIKYHIKPEIYGSRHPVSMEILEQEKNSKGEVTAKVKLYANKCTDDQKIPPCHKTKKFYLHRKARSNQRFYPFPGGTTKESLGFKVSLLAPDVKKIRQIKVYEDRVKRNDEGHHIGNIADLRYLIRYETKSGRRLDVNANPSYPHKKWSGDFKSKTLTLQVTTENYLDEKSELMSPTTAFTPSRNNNQGQTYIRQFQNQTQQRTIAFKSEKYDRVIVQSNEFFRSLGDNLNINIVQRKLENDKDILVLKNDELEKLSVEDRSNGYLEIKLIPYKDREEQQPITRRVYLKNTCYLSLCH
uniref:Uncharacterized protein n=1 Tax=Candidatus Kentrum sp. TUN TaxID=2126343 RepID=A0A451A988_9GAMM|nr:MAG: hypothetical protein BECKTUN1418F_GA0071002_10853 [Candidatus Kentron sp. TUN]VFK62594.1 MAG: hypothetical protein BECKTUN1418E_GA0071001_10833 [Candidatus Kentron sp. TUN]